MHSHAPYTQQHAQAWHVSGLIRFFLHCTPSLPSLWKAPFPLCELALQQECLVPLACVTLIYSGPHFMGEQKGPEDSSP